jgi:hypothetical protein
MPHACRWRALLPQPPMCIPGAAWSESHSRQQQQRRGTERERGMRSHAPRLQQQRQLQAATTNTQQTCVFQVPSDTRLTQPNAVPSPQQHTVLTFMLRTLPCNKTPDGSEGLLLQGWVQSMMHVRTVCTLARPTSVKCSTVKTPYLRRCPGQWRLPVPVTAGQQRPGNHHCWKPVPMPGRRPTHAAAATQPGVG